MITINTSPAAVFRSIAPTPPPTLLVDEADTIFGGKNAEPTKTSRPARRWTSAQPARDPLGLGTRRRYAIPTFAMAALAGIGALPDTIMDRAVVIRMRRRAPGETVAPPVFAVLWPSLIKIRAVTLGPTGWAARLKALEKAEPVMPLEDRAADTWEPLIAVADLAEGHDWPGIARRAAVALTTDGLPTSPTAYRPLPRRVRGR